MVLKFWYNMEFVPLQSVFYEILTELSFGSHHQFKNILLQFLINISFDSEPTWLNTYLKWAGLIMPRLILVFPTHLQVFATCMKMIDVKINVSLFRLCSKSFKITYSKTNWLFTGSELQGKMCKNWRKMEQTFFKLMVTYILSNRGRKVGIS